MAQHRSRKAAISPFKSEAVLHFVVVGRGGVSRVWSAVRARRRLRGAVLHAGLLRGSAAGESIADVTEGDHLIIAEDQLEAVVLRIIQGGRDRCGSGFGKYPLGVLAAVEELVKAGASTPAILAKLSDFRERLAR